MYEFSTLENVKTAELINVFNSSFADHFVRIEVTIQSLAEKILAENIHLDQSAGAFFDGKLAGFMLIGIEGETSYNGGTGVVPEARGNGLTRRMYEFILPKLKAESVYSQQLEVITQNLAAVRSYEKIGFAASRTLVCFKGKVAASNGKDDFNLKFLKETDELLFPTFWNSTPSWQNSLSAINRTKNLHKIVGAFDDEKLVGYIVYTANGRVKQFGVNKDSRKTGIGRALFAFVQSQLNDKEIVITNLDKNDWESLSFLRKLGLKLFLEQIEMLRLI